MQQLALLPHNNTVLGLNVVCVEVLLSLGTLTSSNMPRLRLTADCKLALVWMTVLCVRPVTDH